MNPDRNPWPATRKPEDPIDHEAAKFAAFVEQHRYTADQLRRAYDVMMRVAEPGVETDPAVTELHAEMERLSNNGFPVNRFVELIATREEKEDAAAICMATIDRLKTMKKITENEQRMLCSMVEKRRSGDLTVSYAKEFDSDFEVRFDGTAKGDEQMMNKLLRLFREAESHAVRGQAVEFIFSER